MYCTSRAHAYPNVIIICLPPPVHLLLTQCSNSNISKQSTIENANIFKTILKHQYHQPGLVFLAAPYLSTKVRHKPKGPPTGPFRHPEIRPVKTKLFVD